MEKATQFTDIALNRISIVRSIGRVKGGNYMHTFQEIIHRFNEFWKKQGCCVHVGYDLECGAGTFNPVTFLRCLGPEPYKGAYVEACRRPTDGRYGKNPNRVQCHHQYQVILKPSPPDIQTVYLQSLEAIGFQLEEHDIRFVHDDWESPTLGAWGLGWEAWIDGMEVTQITYFQSFGGIPVKPVTGELTYGLERLAMYLQKKDSIYDIQWNDDLTYGDIFHSNEVEWSHYNFEEASTKMWFKHFDDYENEAKQLIGKNLPLPAYDFVAKASHAFNLLDARGAISVSERTSYISRIRDLAKQVAEEYIAAREKQGYPLLKKASPQIKQISCPVVKDLPASIDEEDYLLEIGSEELPATFVEIGLKSIKSQVEKLLNEEHIKYASIKTMGTPRRLTLLVEKMATAKAAKTTVRKGPPVERSFDEKGNLTQAGQGFFRSLDMDLPNLQLIKSQKVEGIDIREVKGVDYLFVTVKEPSRPTVEILSNALPQIILSTNFPKQMRWADLDIHYARPIVWMVSLFGNQVLPFVVGDTLASNATYGHRQLSPSSIELKHPKEYVSKLKEHFVMVDIEERKQCIIDQLDALEIELNAKIIKRDRLLPEVVHLVEWPRATSTDFNPNFLRVPQELLISEMVEHQKYFPVADLEGKLKNTFIITANNKPTGQIREGNLRVLSARLSDGAFLYDQDLKASLEKFNDKLSHITFLKGLGTLADKVKRLESHAEAIHKALQIGNLDHVKQTARFCKSDLASGVVYEFPELQGTIGKYYAIAKGLPKEVAEGIEEHWMPLGDKAPLPQTPTGIITSIADKLDNLLSCFSVGLIPTSSSDPYALRRQVLGLIKILIQGKFRLSLKTILLNCAKNFPNNIGAEKSTVINEILEFIVNRIKTVFQDYGFSKDEIEASISYGVDDIYDSYCRVKALHAFRNQGSQFPLLFEVYKRAKGQINTNSKIPLNKQLLIETPEKELNDLLEQSEVSFSELVSNHHYEQAYSQMATIQPKLANLFDHVKILADDQSIRNNRIALLQRVFDRFSQLIDFSKIQEM